jgi:long-chain-acyl-CoA dehydrogenase
MERRLFEQEHRIFQTSFRRFVDREITPFHPQWEKDRIVPREVWLKAGASGFLCIQAPEEYGGAGSDDFRYNAIVMEELARAGAYGPAFALHTDIILPYILTLANEEQKRRWLPGMVSGEIISAIAMTEPGCGSDLAAIRTSARLDGDSYVVNGSKIFISNGILNDLAVVVVRTSEEERGYAGISLLVVERGMEGYERGKQLDKMGLHAQDTTELFFRDVRVPKANLLGEENRGFIYLMQNLPQERLSVAIGAVAHAEGIFEQTVEYCKGRKAFGRSISSFQATRFKLAEMKTELELGRVFIDRCIEEHNRKALSAEEACMAKWWCTDLQNRIIDNCVQLHGGYGYMMEYPVARAYVDARISSIYAGTNEIMKELIGRTLGC